MACFWLHIPFVSDCLVRPLRCFAVDFGQIPFHIVLAKQVSSVVSRWIHRCLTAPSMCNGHPAGICDSSRSSSPFCSIISPSIGTSIEVFRLIRGRLHCYISGKVNLVWPVLHRWERRLVADDQRLFFDHEPKAMHGFGCSLS